jgi:DNA replication protein DnaC
MPEEIKKTVKKMSGTTPVENIPTTSTAKLRSKSDLPGDLNCPYCQGSGYYRLDLPVGHPDFGKLHLCTCRQSQLSHLATERLFRLSNLSELAHMTFDSFAPRGRIGIPPVQADSLERAYNQARHFAENLKGWLLLQGGYGCGKTHLAAAVANFVVSLGVPTLFITVPDMLDALRFAYNDPEATFEERFEEIRRVRLLVLDDFGTQNATGWAQEKLFQIINFRYINQLPTLITTNLNLEEIEGRLKSRLRDPELVSRVQMLANDYRDPTNDMGQAGISSLVHLAERTFGTFSERRDENFNTAQLRSLEKAFKAAHDYAEKPSGWLILIGGTGTGKTHLAAAIANYQAGMGYRPLFIFVPDLLDHLRATFNPNSTVRFDRLFDEVRTASLLILDSLDSQTMTPWVREKIYQIFNYRYNAELPTVITTVEKPDEMDPRLRSRILDKRLTSIYALEVPPFIGKPRPASRSKSSKRAS